MKAFKLTAISAALLALSIPAKSDFIDDSKLDLKLRTVYFGVDVEGEESDWDDVAEGIELNLKSGYAFDFIGFDASYYAGLPISTDGKDPYNGYRGQLLDKDKTSYTALGQAYAKIKLGDESLGAYSQLGLMRGKNGGILGTSSRSTPSSYYGGLVEFYPAKGWMLHAGYYTGMKQRTQESVDDFTTFAVTDINTGKDIPVGKIDSIQQIGFTVDDFNGINANIFYLESEDFASLFSTTVGYTYEIDEDSHIKLEGLVERFEGSGDLWNKNIAYAEELYQEDANHYALTFEIKDKALTARAILGYTEAPSDSGIGAMDDRIVGNDYGSSQSPISYLAGNFWYDQEEVLQLEAEYDFSFVGFNGLKVKGGYIIGDNINDERNLIVATPIGAENPTVKGANLNNENEYFLEVNYAFPEESKLNGLSLRMMNAWGEKEYEHKTEKSRYLRWYIDYNIAVF